MGDVSVLVGLTMTSVEKSEDDGGGVVEFTTTDGRRFRLFHDKDCCETVDIESIDGDLADLVGAPLVMAECATEDVEGDEAGQWTFYKFATVKGYVTIRWYGESDYYSLEVDFREVRRP